jgi:hypothetical protein
MSNSYRIRTEIGKDKYINVLIEQDFEQLEILSLKILQSQLYTRVCSDYGVVAGRITANSGLGLPNCRVSVFIPISNEDLSNPIISDLYPYRNLTDTNDDGFRYNLLPYLPSHSGHNPTGSFPDRLDVLTNPNLIEVFDKYYKFTAKTNDSGDFMIFGVPTGTQTIHVDVDLSDIGEFSLSPQDFIRLGLATEAQVAGTQFRSSTDLNTLPQIISFNRTINIEPLWGQPEVCSIGITRTDFDITEEAGVTITPTAIFIGSIISANNDQFQRINCKTKNRQGNLCSLITGPGEILAIRQTIFNDDTGRPVLETYELDSGGQVIDDNGTWMVDVPMNLDYVTTNEFGERVFSDDPKIGVPTKGKYRFKVKWNQSPQLRESLKRGYFLVPNVREYGWINSSQDPLTLPTTDPNYQLAIKSYAFSLDWDDYSNPQIAIDCEDYFYPMTFNKVYTVSQMIDQFRNGYNNERFVGVKNILDDTCESENVKFPTNDAVQRFDLIYLLFIILTFIATPILYILLIASHLVAFTLRFLRSPKWKTFTFLPLPNLTYPDCNLCDCKEGERPPTEGGPTDFEITNSQFFSEVSFISPYTEFTTYEEIVSLTQVGQQVVTLSDERRASVQQLFAGNAIEDAQIPGSRAPQLEVFGNNRKIFTNSITLPERLNLFNTKAKYFDQTVNVLGTNIPNPGGGYNRIGVKFNPSLNPGVQHFDNVVILSVKPDFLGNLSSGSIVTFQDSTLSTDPNLTGLTFLNDFGNYAITGKSVTQLNIDNGISPSLAQSRVVSYAKFNGTGNQNVFYSNLGQSTDDQPYIFPIDVEYFQVITAMTINNFLNTSRSADPSVYTFNQRYLNQSMLFYEINTGNNNTFVDNGTTYYPLRSFNDYENQILVFLVRGVDPYSTIVEVEYDLSVLFGYFSGSTSSPRPNGTIKVRGNNFKLNIPIQSGVQSIKHNMTLNQSIVTFGNISVTSSDGSNPLNTIYHQSYNFIPDKNQFIDFISTLPSYYSSLDNTTPINFLPWGAAPNWPFSNFVQQVLQSNVWTPSSPLRLRSNFLRLQNTDCRPEYLINGFQVRWSQDNCSSGRKKAFDNPTNQLVGGYFPSEIIEGGSFMGQSITLTNNNLEARAAYYAPKYNESYFYKKNPSVGFGVLGRQIVMRSDRLPTSTTLQNNLSNSFALHANIRLAVYIIGDDGIDSGAGGNFLNTPQTNNPNDSIDENGNISVIGSFSCDGLVPLGCYGTTNNEITVLPTTDSCYTNGLNNQIIMKNGCYILITKPWNSLGKDLTLLTEWRSRLQISFAACRNVWSHTFSNNWINGVLYMFPFKSNTTNFDFNNEPIIDYCKKTLVFHPSNNYYYRSSPYRSSTNNFIGANALNSIAYKGNTRNLKFPTTIVDLGPRTDYLQELVFSDDFDGYLVNQLNETTYSDVSEILNLFIISRLVNRGFISQIIAGAGNINSFFSRDNRFVDADYAQMISISSELGVSDFEAINYPQRVGQDPIYFNNANSSNAVFGIFFSSDTQVRDFLTPKRTIINPNNTVNSICSFSDFPVFSQVVPFYQWNMESGDSIFGTQENDWYTNTLGTGFFKERYQSLDRLQQSSRYFRTSPSVSSLTKNSKGYIYAADNNDEYVIIPSAQDLNIAIPNRAITVGAPFHFYFGLKKGKTAFDRFAKKWIKFEPTTD